MISLSQRPLPDNTQHSQQTYVHTLGGIRTHDLSTRAAADLCLRPRGHWDRLWLTDTVLFIRTALKTLCIDSRNVSSCFSTTLACQLEAFISLITTPFLSITMFPWSNSWLPQHLTSHSRLYCFMRNFRAAPHFAKSLSHTEISLNLLKPTGHVMHQQFNTL